MAAHSGHLYIFFGNIFTMNDGIFFFQKISISSTGHNHPFDIWPVETTESMVACNLYSVLLLMQAKCWTNFFRRHITQQPQIKPAIHGKIPGPVLIDYYRARFLPFSIWAIDFIEPKCWS